MSAMTLLFDFLHVLSGTYEPCKGIRGEGLLGIKCRRHSKNENHLLFRGEITDKGDTWKLEKAGALITFFQGSVKEPLMITCSLWSPRALTPPIGTNEVLVSNVIELSHGGPPDLELREDATGNIAVCLLHSASNFKGYEVVIKQLVDPENNEWKDLETTNVWHRSGIKYKSVDTYSTTCHNVPLKKTFQDIRTFDLSQILLPKIYTAIYSTILECSPLYCTQLHSTAMH